MKALLTGMDDSLPCALFDFWLLFQSFFHPDLVALSAQGSAHMSITDARPSLSC